MADTFPLGTLFPADKLQRVVQHYGCPSFADTSTDTATDTGSRFWYIHFFTGRVPTPAEFYYGLYIDRVGDTHKSTPMALNLRYLGYSMVRNDGVSAGAGDSSIGITVQAHGAVWPDGSTFVGNDVDLVRLPPNTYGNSSWVLDWAFPANRAVNLTQGNRANLRSYASANNLPKGGTPTWFWISGSASLPTVTKRDVDYSKVDNAYRAIIEQLPNATAATEWDRRPMLMGTVGTLGSGSDLELATGADVIPDSLNLVSLRVVVADPAVTP